MTMTRNMLSRRLLREKPRTPSENKVICRGNSGNLDGTATLRCLVQHIHTSSKSYYLLC